ncbi:hypothetical protein FB446DRAFT_515173 [Lentinula raphanica]|nr:hypothetical protein FB446DRAFT_515173 [Lentinula raphanica]
MSFFVKLAISLFSLQVLTAEAVLSAEPQIRDIGALCGFEPGIGLTKDTFVSSRSPLLWPAARDRRQDLWKKTWGRI